MLNTSQDRKYFLYLGLVWAISGCDMISFQTDKLAEMPISTEQAAVDKDGLADDTTVENSMTGGGNSTNSSSNETASSPVNVTGVYLVSCSSPVYNGNSATLACSLTDGINPRTSTMPEALWDFQLPTALLDGQSVVVSKPMRDSLVDVIYTFSANSPADLNSLLTQTTLRAVIGSVSAQYKVPVTATSAAVCTTNAKQCSGNIPQVCDAAGQWQRLAECPYGCAAGVCLPGLTGSWLIHCTPDLFNPAGTTLSLTQNPGTSDISGTFTNVYGAGTLSGTYSSQSSQFSITANYTSGQGVGNTDLLKGTITGSAPNRSMSGTYSQTGASPSSGSLSGKEQ